MNEPIPSKWISRLVFVLATTWAVGPSYADESQIDDSETSVNEFNQAEPVGQAQQAIEPAGLNVAIGPLVATRTMQMRTGAEVVDHEPGLYFGGTGRLSIEMVEFESVDAALLLEGEGGYGATRNRDAVAELRRQPVTEWSFLDVRLAVQRPLSEAVGVKVGLGAYANSFIVEPNLTYTGHRYVAADIRLELAWQNPASNWAAGVDLSAHPVLSVNQSSQTDTETSAFGARAGAQIGYNIAQVESTGGYTGARLMVRYDYTRFRTQFPQQRVTLDGGVSEDEVHALTLMLGYFM